LEGTDSPGSYSAPQQGGEGEIDIDKLSPEEVLRLQEGIEGRSALESAVLDAVEAELGNRPMGARWEYEVNRVVVTLWSLGDRFSVQQLGRVRQVAEAVTDGIPAVVEVDDGDPPTEA